MAVDFLENGRDEPKSLGNPDFKPPPSRPISMHYLVHLAVVRDELSPPLRHEGDEEVVHRGAGEGGRLLLVLLLVAAHAEGLLAREVLGVELHLELMKE